MSPAIYVGSVAREWAVKKMRLIDADAIEQDLFDAYWMLDNDEHMVEDILRKQPTIDAVPVVRCKDCRYSEPMKKHGVCKFGENALICTQCRGDDGYGYEGISVIYPDDYCSDGELKDGEADV